MGEGGPSVHVAGDFSLLPALHSSTSTVSFALVSPQKPDDCSTAYCSVTALGEHSSIAARSPQSGPSGTLVAPCGGLKEEEVIYECEQDCGYEHPCKEVVEAHELTCKRKPPHLEQPGHDRQGMPAASDGCTRARKRTCMKAA